MQVHILLVEDEAIDRLRVEKLVKKESLPYDLTIATTIAEALALLKKENFDLALVDYNLPDGLGLEVLKQAGRIPCIFITAQDNTYTAVEVMKAGACDFLVKDDLGYNLKLLPTMVERALERRKTDELTRAVTRLQKEIKERKQVEQELKRSFSLLQATLESTADGILVVDNQGKWSGYNSQFVRMWGIPDEILISRDDQKALNFVLDQLIFPEEFIEKVNELSIQPDAFSHDTLEFKDGRIVERDSRPQMVEGKPVGRVWSFHDNTDRLQRERELETVAQVGNALRAAVSRVEMLPIIINQAVDLLDAETACLEFIDLESGDSVLELGYGAWQDLVGMHLSPNEGLNSYIRATGKPYLNNHVADDPMIPNPVLFTTFNALAGAPMIAQGELIGFLWVGRKTNFNQSDLRPLAALPISLPTPFDEPACMNRLNNA
jgi:PAS domain S-box-containing protein